jgi:TonB family protein
MTDFTSRSAVRVFLCVCLAILSQVEGVLAGWNPTLVLRWPASSRKYYDTPPKFISGSTPHWPMSQWHSGNSGFAVVAFTVGLDGKAHDIRVVEASYPYFGSHTIIAIRNWKFEPARKNGQPVPLKTELVAQFSSR